MKLFRKLITISLKYSPSHSFIPLGEGGGDFLDTFIIYGNAAWVTLNISDHVDEIRYIEFMSLYVLLYII